MAIGRGGLVIFGYDADCDTLILMATEDISGGEVVYLVNNEWNGTGWVDNNEGFATWQAGAGGVSAGAVSRLDNVAAGQSPTASHGSISVTGNFNSDTFDEAIWVAQGTDNGSSVTVSNFISLISNEDMSQFFGNQAPNLAGTGLDPSRHVAQFQNDEDYLEFLLDGGSYTQDEFLLLYADPANWATGLDTNPNGPGNFDLEDTTFTDGDPVCFAAGTLIETSAGPRPIETLTAGAEVMTLDHGLQPVRWIGMRRITSRALDAKPHLLPVRIAAGALGEGLPARELVLSPQHRVLIENWKSPMLFGEDVLLTSAKSLLNLPGVSVLRPKQVDYYHILFSRHEIVFAEGACCESLFAGAQALANLGDRAAAEIHGILGALPAIANRGLARPAISCREAGLLCRMN